MDFRYLTECKNEFHNFLCNIIVPHLYTGISGMLEYSIHTCNLLEEKRQKNKNIQNPGVLNIFKMCLNDISSINNYEIENEYKRIKENSGCIEWFDNLVRATFKSYVLFLTWDPNTLNSKYNDNTLYEKISIKDFIHKCYIETCNYFKENPEIFLKKSVKKEVYDIIKNCIELSIKKTLPYNEIIQEYLKINFKIDNEKNNKKEIDNIKLLVNKLILQNNYGTKPNKVLMSDTSTENNENDIKVQRDELKNFINNEINNKEYPNIDLKTEETNVNEYKEQEGGDKPLENVISSTPILTRSEIKRQEVEHVLNDIKEGSEHNEQDVNKEIENKEIENKKDNEDKKDDIEVITSPIPIRKNNEQRLEEEILKMNDNKKVNIVKTVSNKDIIEKIEDMDGYFSSLIK